MNGAGSKVPACGRASPDDAAFPAFGVGPVPTARRNARLSRKEQDSRRNPAPAATGHGPITQTCRSTNSTCTTLKGEQAPDLELEYTGGGTVSLSDELQDGPAVVLVRCYIRNDYESPFEG